MKIASDKNITIIASAGRTGTNFLADQLSNLIEDSFSTHEPDQFKIIPLKKFPLDIVQKTSKFGFRQMFIDKIFKDIGIRQLSEGRFSGKYSEQRIIEIAFRLRSKYYSKIPQSIIIESNYVWYGILDLFTKEYSNVKGIVISRHPKDWVRSNMNWERQYGKKDFPELFSFSKLNAKQVKDLNYSDKWDKMDRFEKLCWMWNFIYSKLYELNETNDKVTFYKYEDLFLSPDKNKNFSDLILKVVGENSNKHNFDPRIFDHKSNINSSYNFPDWSEWTIDEKQTLIRICGETMSKIGYE